MSTLDEQFLEYSEKVKHLKCRPGDDDLLELYGLFKQANEGDISEPAPFFIEFKAKAKWNAWNGRKGMSKEDAKKQYIEAATKCIEKYGMA
ncbi:hypothetical protein CRM22_008485 [Opisthorchis felineus]|uniref:ACB domain-containing protein n=1 Tax=Opisthorchis felineus TaxID=147828 RepID=A0A4S2LBL4_OPIFE|nr:hypothetical protein CRM22_008485 [Opisthorchis felineus]